jgi:hypothetical protein
MLRADSCGDGEESRNSHFLSYLEGTVRESACTLVNVQTGPLFVTAFLPLVPFFCCKPNVAQPRNVEVLMGVCATAAVASEAVFCGRPWYDCDRRDEMMGTGTEGCMQEV